MILIMDSQLLICLPFAVSNVAIKTIINILTGSATCTCTGPSCTHLVASFAVIANGVNNSATNPKQAR